MKTISQTVNSFFHKCFYYNILEFKIKHFIVFIKTFIIVYVIINYFSLSKKFLIMLKWNLFKNIAQKKIIFFNILSILYMINNNPSLIQII